MLRENESTTTSSPLVFSAFVYAAFLLSIYSCIFCLSGAKAKRRSSCSLDLPFPAGVGRSLADRWHNKSPAFEPTESNHLATEASRIARD